MQTEVKQKYDVSEEPPPLPPAPHFDLASIAEAKPVQPLRRRRIPRFSPGVLRLATAVLAGFGVLVLGIATMARLNNQINVAPASTTASQPGEPIDDASSDVDTDSASAAFNNSSSLVVTERHRHRGRHHMRGTRDMFEQNFVGPPMFGFEEPPVNGRTRARLVTVIQ